MKAKKWYIVRNVNTDPDTCSHERDQGTNRFDTLAHAKRAAIEWAEKANGLRSYIVYEVKEIGVAGPAAQPIRWKAAR